MNALKRSLNQGQKILPCLCIAFIAIALQFCILKFLELLGFGPFFKTFQAGLLFTLILGFANSFPLIPLISQSLKRQLFLFPLSLLLMNGFLIWLIDLSIPDIFINNLWAGIPLLAAISIVSMAVGTLYTIDDCQSYERFVVRPLIQRYGNSEKTDVPGIIFLEIDGLSESLLKKALNSGCMPTLKRWLESGSHKLTRWETDLSSESAASQAGILHGCNFNIPAYSWYEKDKDRLFFAANPKDAADVERRISSGRGLLARNGASRANMFSGDAPDCLLTVSTLMNPGRYKSAEYFLLFTHTYMIFRTTAIFLAHLITEYFYGWQQAVRDEHPRINSGGIYPFLRAASTGILRELSVFMLIGDMIRGMPSIYVAFDGYDTVAHHSGIARKDAMDVLAGLDNMISWLESFSKYAARPYRFVVHSDHGQCQGATFLQRYDKSLGDMVSELTGRQTISLSTRDHESWSRIGLSLTEISNQDSKAGKLLRSALKKRIVYGAAKLGQEGALSDNMRTGVSKRGVEAVVLASGNLGLIYFTARKERMSLEQINDSFPKLIPGLLSCEYIGFILVRSDKHGPMAIGSNGICYLNNDRVVGINPLAGFGSLAAERLRRESSFTNVADIVVNSFYNSKTEEIAAFEELLGSHGGLGGDQSLGFLMYPSELDLGANSIFGAEQLHKVMKRWVSDDRMERLSLTRANNEPVSRYISK